VRARSRLPDVAGVAQLLGLGCKLVGEAPARGHGAAEPPGARSEPGRDGCHAGTKLGDEVEQQQRHRCGQHLALGAIGELRAGGEGEKQRRRAGDPAADELGPE
jgi:hypothetical protein